MAVRSICRWPQLHSGSNAALSVALAELERSRAKSPQSSADRETSGDTPGEIAALRKALEETQAQLAAEQAKVFLMEAASIAPPPPRAAKTSASDPSRRDRLIADLQAHVRKLHETNEALRATRDQAFAEMQRLAQKLEERATEDDVFEASLSKVSVDLNEIGRMIARKRGSGGTLLLL